MTENLVNLYSSKWEILSQKLQEVSNAQGSGIKPTNPLLITLEKSNYENADIKVMIFGQETNSWYDDFKGDLETTLNLYRDFFNSGFAINKYGGQFWNGVKRFKDLLSQRYPDKSIGLAWNNIIKIGCAGRNQNTPPRNIYELEKEHFNVIKEEIQILKPDIILFLSGPNYDYAVKDTFGKYTMKPLSEKFSQRQLAKVDIGYGHNVFRTYHPNYLWRNNINNYFEEIIKGIEI